MFDVKINIHITTTNLNSWALRLHHVSGGHCAKHLTYTISFNPHPSYALDRY